MKSKIYSLILAIIYFGSLSGTKPVLVVRKTDSKLQYFSASSGDSIKFGENDSLLIYNSGSVSKIAEAQFDSAYFGTATLPSIETVSAVFNYTTNKALCTVNIKSNGGVPLIERGICWSTSHNPTILDNKYSNGTSTGQFYALTSILNAGTIYYVRSYAKNCIGIAYSNEIKVMPLPSYVYNPTVFGDETSNFNWTRHAESEHFIVYWEPGFGNDPSTTGDSYSTDINKMLKSAELCFKIYSDSLKFLDRNNSKTQKYKMIIKLFYTKDWFANGSGVDDVIGALNITPSAAPSDFPLTISHEIGHCFQYQIRCDLGDDNHGFRYGLGNGGGNGYWEQTAQWQALQIVPLAFNNGWSGLFVDNAFKSPFHEDNRYNNYFINYYWNYKHGNGDMIGRIWRESIKPEDPAQAYMRLNNLTLEQYNDETWDMAARWATWDIPALRAMGAVSKEAISTPMIAASNNYWWVDSTACVQDQGINIIPLNAPTTACTVNATFEGMAGATGYRNVDPASRAGWRYGFVALLNDNTTRLYGTMQSNPNGTATIDVPANISKLWFVVTGAPNTYKVHSWDDNASNDEQWPYKVKFTNTSYSK